VNAALDAVDRAEALKLTPVSRETLARLDAYVALLLQWQETTNLIAPSTVSSVWTRHIADSLQLLDSVSNKTSASIASPNWADLGSGAGLPGVVLACALTDSGGFVHLVESNAKKAAFLREAVRVTGAAAMIHPQRIEHFTRGAPDIDVVTARALAPLTQLLSYVQPFMVRGAQAILPKGQDVEAELTEASKYWRIEADLRPSRTNKHSHILVIHRLEPRQAIVSS
jgi:16S rRNA (guanine527-N7)-methyltransferase